MPNSAPSNTTIQKLITPNDQFKPGALRPLIFEEDDFGDATRFKIFNPNREQQLRALVDGTEFIPIDETQKRLKENFATISYYLA